MRSDYQYLLLGLLLISPMAQAGDVLVSGNSMFEGDSTFTGNLNQLDHDYTFVSPADFSSQTFDDFDAIWLDGFSLFPGLSSLEGDLIDFMERGGVLLVQNPGFGSEPLSDYPMTDGLTASINLGGYESINLHASDDIINDGLSGGGLSNWGSSALGRFGSNLGSFRGLSDNGTAGEWMTISRSVGLGLLIYTQQAISQALRSGSFSASNDRLEIIDNAFSYLESATLFIDGSIVDDRRFAIQVGFDTTQGGGKSGQGRSIALADQGVDRGGLFWFFNPANPELLIKVLDACSFNDRFWVFYSAGTSVGLDLRVTDTLTDTVWTSTNADGTAAPPIQDTDAIVCN